MWDGGGADSDDDGYVYDDDAMDVASARDDDDMDADDGRPVVPAYDEKARLAEALEESKQDTGSNAVAVDPAFAADPAAPPLHDASLAAAVAPEPAAQPVQSALATPAAAAAGPQLEPPTIDDEEPDVGSKDWWEKSGLAVKCLKPTDTPFKTKYQSRRDAQKANLRSESTGLEGWNVSRVDALLAYWHTNDKTRYTTRVIPLRAKLELDAPKRKSTRRGFSHPSTEKNHAKAKLEQTGNQAPDYYQRPEVIAARSEGERRMLFLKA